MTNFYTSIYFDFAHVHERSAQRKRMAGRLEDGTAEHGPRHLLLALARTLRDATPEEPSVPQSCVYTSLPCKVLVKPWLLTIAFRTRIQREGRQRAHDDDEQDVLKKTGQSCAAAPADLPEVGSADSRELATARIASLLQSPIFFIVADLTCTCTVVIASALAVHLSDFPSKTLAHADIFAISALNVTPALLRTLAKADAPGTTPLVAVPGYVYRLFSAERLEPFVGDVATGHEC